MAAIGGYRDLGYSRFAVELKESGTLIGYCGFRDSRPWDYVDFGWAYAKRYWRRGYATEAARAVLSSAPALGLDRIVCIVDPENVASRRVVEKIGMPFVGYINCEGGVAMRYVEDVG